MPSIIIHVVNGQVVYQPDVPGAQPDEPLKVIPGALVTWNNRTNDPHWPIACDPPGLFLTNSIPPNDASSPIFNVTQAPSTKITYVCAHHPAERRVIEVITPP